MSPKTRPSSDFRFTNCLGGSGTGKSTRFMQWNLDQRISSGPGSLSGNFSNVAVDLKGLTFDSAARPYEHIYQINKRRLNRSDSTDERDRQPLAIRQFSLTEPSHGWNFVLDDWFQALDVPLKVGVLSRLVRGTESDPYFSYSSTEFLDIVVKYTDDAKSILDYLETAKRIRERPKAYDGCDEELARDGKTVVLALKQFKHYPQLHLTPDNCTTSQWENRIRLDKLCSELCFVFFHLRGTVGYPASAIACLLLMALVQSISHVPPHERSILVNMFIDEAQVMTSMGRGIVTEFEQMRTALHNVFLAAQSEMELSHNDPVIESAIKANTSCSVWLDAECPYQRKSLIELGGHVEYKHEIITTEDVPFPEKRTKSVQTQTKPRFSAADLDELGADPNLALIKIKSDPTSRNRLTYIRLPHSLDKDVADSFENRVGLPELEGTLPQSPTPTAPLPPPESPIPELPPIVTADDGMDSFGETDEELRRFLGNADETKKRHAQDGKERRRKAS